MIDHDPGDEDRRDVVGDTCPFCGASLELARVWKTPVAAWTPQQWSFLTAIEAAKIDPSDVWKGEIIVTCLDCKPAARLFQQEQRRSWDAKTTRRYTIDYERRAGLRP